MLHHFAKQIKHSCEEILCWIKKGKFYTKIFFCYVNIAIFVLGYFFPKSPGILLRILQLHSWIENKSNKVV